VIEIIPSFFIEESDLSFEYIKASGPGGQNINKVSSAVRLRFNVNSSSLTMNEKQRLKKLAGNRITENGFLIIEAKRFRSQEQNRSDALQRFSHLIEAALKEPTIRLKNFPSKSSRAIRTNEKKRHGALKKNRKFIPEDWK
jgi:ribosome-associated protein